MEILFIKNIIYINIFNVLFCWLNSILDYKVIVLVLLSSLIIIGSLVTIYLSKFGDVLKTGGKIIIAGGLAKAGAYAYDKAVEVIKDIGENKSPNKYENKGDNGSDSSKEAKKKIGIKNNHEKKKDLVFFLV